MTIKVKICGLRSGDALDAAAEAGADYFGLVFFPASPRHVSLADAARLAAAARGRIASVAVLVDPDDGLLDEVTRTVVPDALQLHGAETPERVAEIKRRTGASIIKAIPVAAAEDVARASAYSGIADLVLYDAKAPQGALPGGRGSAFDWRLLDGAAKGFALSGGLTPQNVAEAIAVSGAGMVDVSSGVERAPGEKDCELIRAFITAAKGPRAQAARKAS